MVLNSVCFFLTFLFGRLLYQGYIMWWSSGWVAKNLGVYSGLEYGLLWFVIVSQLIGFALNIHWMSLIIKQLMRMISKPKVKSTPQTENKKTK
jgi:hypothetical protein